jgi:hypothetical protein
MSLEAELVTRFGASTKNSSKGWLLLRGVVMTYVTPIVSRRLVTDLKHTVDDVCVYPQQPKRGAIDAGTIGSRRAE